MKTVIKFILRVLFVAMGVTVFGVSLLREVM